MSYYVVERQDEDGSWCRVAVIAGGMALSLPVETLRGGGLGLRATLRHGDLPAPDQIAEVDVFERVEEVVLTLVRKCRMGGTIKEDDLNKILTTLHLEHRAAPKKIKDNKKKRRRRATGPKLTESQREALEVLEAAKGLWIPLDGRSGQALVRKGLAESRQNPENDVWEYKRT